MINYSLSPWYVMMHIWFFFFWWFLSSVLIVSCLIWKIRSVLWLPVYISVRNGCFLLRTCWPLTAWKWMWYKRTPLQLLSFTAFVMSMELQTTCAISVWKSYVFSCIIFLFVPSRLESCLDYRHLGFCVSKEISTYTWCVSGAHTKNRYQINSEWSGIHLPKYSPSVLKGF